MTGKFGNVIWISSKNSTKSRETTDFTSENTDFPCMPPQEPVESEEPVEPDNVELDSNTENDTQDASSI